jgi:CHAT domain-containing protein/tetratricopeptide (TPR) repeat protein
MNEKLNALLRIGELQLKAGTLMIHSEAVKRSGDWNKAHVVYQDYIATQQSLMAAALDHNEKFPDSPYEIPPIANTLVNALMVGADIVQSLGRRKEAEGLRQEALRTSRTHLGREGTAETERSRAASLTLEGRFNEAIVALMGTRDLIMEKNDLLELTRVTIDLADVLQWLGDFTRAKEEILHAETLIEPLLAEGAPSQKDVLSGLLSDFSSIMAGQGDPGSAMQNMQLYRASTEVTYYHGLISRALGEWDEAERCMNKVLPEYRKLGAGESIEYQLAMINVGRGQHREALEQLGRLGPVFETGAFRPKKGILQRAQAECLFALGEASDALRLLDESVEDLTQTHFDPDGLWHSQWCRARVLAAEGKRDLCLKSLEDTVETINSLRRAPLGFRLDSTFLEDKLEVFSTAVEETMKADDLKSCCVFMDSIKSRTLSAVLSIPASTNGPASGPESELEELTRQLDVMEYQAYREGWNTQRKTAHRDMLAKRANLLERIRISDPRWRTLTEPVELDFDGLLDSLARRGQAALSLYFADERIHAVLLIDGELLGDTLDLSRDTIKKLKDYVRNLQKRSVDVFKHDLSAEFSVMAEHLIPPALLAKAVTAKSLVVVPHGGLHLVPWSGLLHGDKRLFEFLPVGVLPNLGPLLRQDEAAKPASVALVGLTHYGDAGRLDDLPSAGEEIEAIAKVYDGQRIIGKLLDREATEASFWKLAKGVRGAGNVLHMSCHGVIVPNEPMSSGLLLDGSKLDAAEVARGGLGFDEVVLSACSTGWRPTEVEDVLLSSDEILGIPGGFLESGVGSVLVSIPKSEGKTARDLTVHYHERRVAGESPLFAFRSAQMHMLKQDGAKPALWIGFTLYGCR